MRRANDGGCELEVYNCLTLLHERGEVFEIRVPKTVSNGTMAGYFDDAGLAAKAIQAIDGRVPSVYVTLNPVQPDLLARCNNRIENRVQVTTTDGEIIRRRWLPLDFDPIRPAGISSTDEEHDAAVRKAEEVRRWLSERGWPQPIVGDSGNGAHLLYRIDLPNDTAAMVLIQNIIRAIAALFSDKMVDVDQTVFNASRIWKVYGTLARKGDSTASRPHRRARTEAATVPEVVPLELLHEVGDMWAPDPGASNPAATATGSGGRIGDLGEWLEKMGQTIVAGPLPMFQGKGKKWVLSHCPFNPAHVKPIVGIVEGRPLYKCLHQSCQSNHWADFRAKIDPSHVDPEQVVNDIINACSLDPNSIHDRRFSEQLGAHSVAYYRKVRDRLSAAGVRGLAALDQAVSVARNARLVGEGERSLPNNAYSLSLELESLQEEGVMPVVWIDSNSDRMWAQYAGQEMELAKVEQIAIAVTIELHRRGMSWVKKNGVIDVIQHLAEVNHRNMLQEEYRKLVWDRVPRIDHWLHRYLGVPDTEYSRAVGRKWLISIVARAMRPGCQSDHMLILEGPQGIGKSQAMRILGGDYHVEYAGSLRNDSDHKDMIHTIVGKSIVEISELSAFKGSSIERLKNVLTTTVDDVRLAYRRDASRFPRTCGFAGTTNEINSAYISDSTGARRFWPVVCGPAIDIEALRQDRDQIWAEAVNAFDAGEDWHTVPVDATKEEQEARSTKLEDDFIFQKIFTNLVNKENIDQNFIILAPLAAGKIYSGERKYFTMYIDKPAITLAIWTGVGDNPAKSMQTHIYNMLKAMGFERVNNTVGASRFSWRYNPALCSIEFVRAAIERILDREFEKFQQPM